MKAIIAAMMLVTSVAMADHHEAKKDAPVPAAGTETTMAPGAGNEAPAGDAKAEAKPKKKGKKKGEHKK